MKGLALLAAKSWFNWIVSAVRREKLVLKVWKNDNELFEDHSETFLSNENSKSTPDEPSTGTDKEERRYKFSWSAKETLKVAIAHFGRKWYRRLLFMGKLVKQIAGSFWKLWVRSTHMLQLFSHTKLSPLVFRAATSSIEAFLFTIIY